MVRPIPIHAGENFCLIPLAIGLFVQQHFLYPYVQNMQKKYQENTQLITPKLITAISNKAPLTPRKSAGEEFDAKVNEGFGQGGLWQKAILMGETISANRRSFME
ncbi:Hypothetical predicted protein [Olea europaea subsp. europaea]|uniref:Uncharacterized protein n=1 Tax=Olea europaea subsp. europaea TaxID=158383 RepID=A0A8S0QIC5_OLEEU|nr:Hypothetical predicted protein [Olea europaea subsp. europaea]